MYTCMYMQLASQPHLRFGEVGLERKFKFLIFVDHQKLRSLVAQVSKPTSNEAEHDASRLERVCTDFNVDRETRTARPDRKK